MLSGNSFVYILLISAQAYAAPVDLDELIEFILQNGLTISQAFDATDSEYSGSAYEYEFWSEESTTLPPVTQKTTTQPSATQTTITQTTTTQPPDSVPPSPQSPASVPPTPQSPATESLGTESHATWTSSTPPPATKQFSTQTPFTQQSSTTTQTKLNSPPPPTSARPTPPTCGSPAKNNGSLKKIIDGHFSSPHSWPWQVSVMIDGDHECGGSAISDRFVISAGHCFTNIRKHQLTLGFGMYNRSSTKEGSVTRKVKSVTIHPRYDDVTIDYDIAVLELYTPLTFGPTIQPICLPASGEIPANRKACYVTGWGETRRNVSEHESNQVTEVLMQATTRIVSDARCNKAHGYSLITSIVLCGTASTGDSCQGDSGGPLNCQRADGKWYLAGIVSWGEDCGGKVPGVYTQVERFLSFIRQTTQPMQRQTLL